MKLVNPVGRTVDDIINEASYGCCCSNDAQDTYAFNRDDRINYGQYSCMCQCSYGIDNLQANYNRGYNN